MSRKISTIAGMALALGVLGVSCGARADQITIGASTSGTITFTTQGLSTINVSFSGVSGFGYFQSPFTHPGTYSFSDATYPAFGFGSGQFGTDGMQTFTFTASDGDTLTGRVHWDFIQDDTTNPTFFGTRAPFDLLITSVSGDAAFMSAFPVNSDVPIDFNTTALSSGGTLDQLAALFCTAPGVCPSATAGVSAGEVTGAVVGVPGPIAGAGLPGLILACGGLLGWWRRRA